MNRILSIACLAMANLLMSIGQVQATTLTVTSASDSGSGTLRQLVSSASAGDTIAFDPMLNGATIMLSSGEIMIDRALVIQGNGADFTILSGANSNRIFAIDMADSVIISGVQFVDGMTMGSGGAISNLQTHLRLSDCEFSRNVATGAAGIEGGGALYNQGGTLMLSQCNLFDNAATGASGSGGAILNGSGGSLIAQDSRITSNQSNRAGGGIEDNSGAGTTFTLTDVELRDNSTGAAPGNGGGLHITGAGDLTITGGVVFGNVAAAEGGGLWNGSGTMTVDGVIIDNNTASGDAADQGGGGVFNAGGTVMITNQTRISQNVADGMSGSGGGILNDAGGMLTVMNSRVNSNRANRAGGGIEDNSGASTTVMLTDVQLRSNQTGAAPGNGGAVHITGPGDMTLVACKVIKNTAAAEGGGLWNGSGTMTVTGGIVLDNVASGDMADQGGGGLFNNGGSLTVEQGTRIIDNVADGSSGSGGGILNDVGGSLTVNNCRIEGNQASRAGGGIEDNSGAGTTFVLQNVALRGNHTGAAPGNGGAVHITGAGDLTISRSIVERNSAAAEGGGLWNGSGTMTIEKTSIERNVASGNDPDQGGGGVFNNGGTVIIGQQTNLFGNVADGSSGSGGGILNAQGGSLMVMDTRISGNSAMRAGGGIEDVSGAGTTFTLTDVELRSNQTGAAPGNGGGVHITGAGDLAISGGVVFGNSAAAEGGGLWNGTGTMTIDDVIIDSNVASGDAADQGGGGVFNAGGMITIQNGTRISENVADGMSGSGGGILNDAGGSLTVMDSRIAGNSANRAGGGIEDNAGASGMVMLAEVLIRNNTTGAAPGNGGGVHITGPGNLDIVNSVVRENVAAAEGGGLWNGTGTMTIDEVLIERNVASGDPGDQGGGGVFNAGGMVFIQNGTRILDNQADGMSGSGGGILNDAGGSLTVMDSRIAGNSANRAGGGIEDNSGMGTTFALTNVDLINNTVGMAPGNGGGVHITGPGDLTIVGGNVKDNYAFAEGGGLWNGSGLMIIDQVNIDHNLATGAGADQGGGGVFNNGGTIEIMRSTIADNETDGMNSNGGGLHNAGGGTVKVLRSTISGNLTQQNGAGIFNRGTLQLANSTVALNVAQGQGGGIAQEMAMDSVSVRSSIVASNLAVTGKDIFFPVGVSMSMGYNLIGMDDAMQFPAQASDLVGSMMMPIDPQLAGLGNNGGPTRTHALLMGSPALDAGDPADQTPDQRDSTVANGQRDIGAFESQTLMAANRTIANEAEAIGFGSADLALAMDADRLTLSGQLMPQATELTVLNLQGQELHRETLEEQLSVEVNLNQFAAGAYLIRLRGQDFLHTEKFLKR